MLKKLGELNVDKSADYNDEVAKALEKAGYILVFVYDDMIKRHYIIAKTESEE